MFDSKTYDSSGKLIAYVPVLEYTGVAPFTGQSFHIHDLLSVTAVCTGSSETPGKSQSWTYTYIISFDTESGVPTFEATAHPL